MKTTFYILISIKTDNGYESFGRLYIGDNPDTARLIFSRLKGKSAVKEDCMLLIELMETRDGLPVNLKVLACTLAELTENFKTITTEIFKVYTLKGAD